MNTPPHPTIFELSESNHTSHGNRPGMWKRDGIFTLLLSLCVSATEFYIINVFDEGQLQCALLSQFVQFSHLTPLYDGRLFTQPWSDTSYKHFHFRCGWTACCIKLFYLSIQTPSCCSVYNSFQDIWAIFGGAAFIPGFSTGCLSCHTKQLTPCSPGELVWLHTSERL